MKKKVEITKDMTLVEVLNYVPHADTILMGFGMHCFSCPVAQQETVEQASEVHSVDLKLLLDKLNGK